MGVTFVRDSIHSLKREADGWKVVCATQTFDCPTIVLSMGAWSADVLRPLGFSVPLMAERGYRHLPVLDAGKVVGMISIGDAVKHIIRDLELNVSDLMGYIMADGPGG